MFGAGDMFYFLAKIVAHVLSWLFVIGIFCQPKSDASAGCDRGPAGTTESDPLRQRAGVNESAFSSLVCGATDRVGTHSAGKANPERTRREL